MFRQEPPPNRATSGAKVSKVHSQQVLLILLPQVRPQNDSAWNNPARSLFRRVCLYP